MPFTFLPSSAIVSLTALFSTTVVLMSCLFCKRIFTRKTSENQSNINDCENDSTVLTKTFEDNKKSEHGTENVSFGKDDETEDTYLQDKTTEKLSPTHIDIISKVPGSTRNDCTAQHLKQNEGSQKQMMYDENQKEDTEGHEDDTVVVENARANAITLKPNSYSIRSNDVEDFSNAIEKVVIHDHKSQLQSSKPNDHGNRADWERYENIVIPGGWRREVKLIDLLQLGLVDETTADDLMITFSQSDDITDDALVPDTLKPYIFGECPVAGIIISESGEKKSIYRSAKDGILRRGTAISLLEAQAATGNIIDPITGRKMSVADAFQLGLLDKVYETVVSRAERAVVGFKSKISNSVMSLGQAMERGLVIESHGIRLLEAQLATGGIIDHEKNIKLPIDIAVQQGILNQSLADKLSSVCSHEPEHSELDELKTFFDPNTEENVTYVELMKRSIIDEDTGLRLYPLEKIGRRRFSYASYSGISSLASSRASSKESIPTAVAAST
ncbi:uncharacterized protein LOC100182972 [Ciona intestinalis]